MKTPKPYTRKGKKYIRYYGKEYEIKKTPDFSVGCSICDRGLGHSCPAWCADLLSGEQYLSLVPDQPKREYTKRKHCECAVESDAEKCTTVDQGIEEIAAAVFAAKNSPNAAYHAYNSGDDERRAKYQYLKMILEVIIRSSFVVDPKYVREALPVIDAIENCMQRVLGLPEDPKKHRYSWDLHGCTCPRMDNLDRFGTGDYYVTEGCPFHDKK